MSTRINHINGYILAGGKSSRMGTDKGLMILRGKPIVQYVLEQLKLTFKTVAIISNNPEYEKFGVQVIPDRIQGVGPAGGILAALSHADTAYNFIVGCDMPFITTSAIELLLKEVADTDIVLPIKNGRFDPLFGVYSKSCIPIWQDLIDKKMIKLQEMVSHFNVRKIDIGYNKQFNEKVLMNINTINDLEKAINII